MTKRAEGSPAGPTVQGSAAPGPSPALSYGVAILGTAFIVGFRSVLTPVLGHQGPFTPFLMAVIAAAWYGGLKPGLLATALGSMAGTYLFLGPVHSLVIADPAHTLLLGIFGIEGVLTSYLCEQLHRSRHAAEQSEATLRRQTEEVEEAGRRKDEFLAMLAHELRNPLAPITVALQLLPHIEEPETSEKGREIIDRQIKHLVRLVDDLMDVARITRGRIELRSEQVQISSIISMAVETSGSLIAAGKHELKVKLPAEPLLILGDAVRLSQVLSNLLQNAAKYTNEGGQIFLTVERDDDRALIRVRDTGMGIAAEMLPYVFDLFAQGDRSKGLSRGGLGIGLNVVRRLVEMHAGEVSARSGGPGKGSEFLVWLPLLPAGESDREVAKRLEVAQSGATQRVLIVDDDRDSTDSFAALSGLWGHDTRSAYDGPSALQIARDFRPNVILLDIGMPEMDGYEVARQLRQEHGQAVRIIAITGYSQDADRRATREAGFDEHLVKPFEPAGLQALLNAAQQPQ